MLGRGFRKSLHGAPVLLPLLGHTVRLAAVPADGTVRWGFDDGSVVEVLDSSTHYESYQVNLRGRLLIVFDRRTQDAFPGAGAVNTCEAVAA